MKHDRDPYWPFWWLIIAGIAAVLLLVYATMFYKGGTP